jgi:hypothetical protein
VQLHLLDAVLVLDQLGNSSALVLGPLRHRLQLPADFVAGGIERRLEQIGQPRHGDAHQLFAQLAALPAEINLVMLAQLGDALGDATAFLEARGVVRVLVTGVDCGLARRDQPGAQARVAFLALVGERLADGADGWERSRCDRLRKTLFIHSLDSVLQGLLDKAADGFGSLRAHVVGCFVDLFDGFRRKPHAHNRIRAAPARSRAPPLFLFNTY